MGKHIGRKPKKGAPLSAPVPATPYGVRKPAEVVDTSPKLHGRVVGNQSTWYYHGAEVDVENKYQPIGSKKVVKKMKALLQGSVNEYREAFCHASDFNPEVRALLESITVNQTNMRRIDSIFLGSSSLESMKWAVQVRRAAITMLMMMNYAIKTRPRRAFGKRPPAAPRKPKGKPGRPFVGAHGGESTAVPQQFRTSSEAVPQQLRSWLRSSSAAAPDGGDARGITHNHGHRTDIELT